MKTETFFFVREEDDTKIVYRMKYAWVPFALSWFGIIGLVIWIIAPGPVAANGGYLFLISVVLFLLRWILCYRANREIVEAKYNNQVMIAGSKFSREYPLIITIRKKTASQSEN